MTQGIKLGIFGYGWLLIYAHLKCRPIVIYDRCAIRAEARTFFFFLFCLSAQHPQSDRVIRGVQYCNRVCIWMFLVRYIMTGCIFRAPSALWQGQVLTPPPPAAPPIHLRSRVPPPPPPGQLGCWLGTAVVQLKSMMYISHYFKEAISYEEVLVYFCFHNDQPAVVYPEERRGWGWGDSNLFARERNGSSKQHNPSHAAVSLTEQWQAANYNFEDIGPLFGPTKLPGFHLPWATETETL